MGMSPILLCELLDMYTAMKIVKKGKKVWYTEKNQGSYITFANGKATLFEKGVQQSPMSQYKMAWPRTGWLVIK